VYPFHYTKNLFFSCTFLLFRSHILPLYLLLLVRIVSPSDLLLVAYTIVLYLTTGCILTVAGSLSSIAFAEIILLTLYRPTNYLVSFSILFVTSSSLCSVWPSPPFCIHLSYSFFYQHIALSPLVPFLVLLLPFSVFSLSSLQIFLLSHTFPSISIWIPFLNPAHSLP